MKRCILSLLVIVLLVAAFAGCAHKPVELNTLMIEYPVKGHVVEVDGKKSYLLNYKSLNNLLQMKDQPYFSRRVIEEELKRR